MKSKKLTKFLAALFTGAMLLATPAVAQASTHSHTVSTSVPAVSGLKVIQVGGEDYLSWSTSLADSQYLYLEYSTDKTFPDNDKTSWTNTYVNSGDNRIRISSYLDLDAGKTYYIRGFVRQSTKVTDAYGESYYTSPYTYGSYSSTVTYTAKVADVSVSECTAGSTQVYFNFSNSNVTGYQIYRATGSGSYKSIAKISDTVYTDTGLTAKTTYNYKIRAYVYDKDTKKTTYGDWYYRTVTTWGKSLQVNAVAASTKSVKLTWNKVTGAAGYKIYRSVGTNTNNTLSGGKYDTFSNYKLVKTLTKASKVSYTDKKLTAGSTYTYLVVAYTTSGAKATETFRISGSDSVTLAFENGMNTVSSVDQSNGGVKLTWKKVVGASGYKIEKYNSTKGAYAAYKTLGSSTTSYTFPAATSTDGYDEYRIYAYNGNNISNSLYVETTRVTVAAPSQVTAAATADGTGVKISWKAVSGASYYRVYRSRRLGNYNADAKYYYLPSSTSVYTQTDTFSMDYEIKTTSVTDQDIVYTYSDGETDTAYEGPRQGIVYYYYVRAYKENGEEVSNSRISAPARIVLNGTSLQKPTLSSVKSKKKAQAAVSWKKVSGATKYYVYYSTKKGSGYKLAGTTAKTSLTVKKLTSGKKYYFKVKAYTTNAVGADLYSSLSAAKSVSVK